MIKHTYHLAQYCSENYFESRNRFLEAAKANSKVVYTESIPLTVKGPNDESLYIDIAWLGNTFAKKTLIHISGTHGVEGFAGSGIQQNLLEQSFHLEEDTAIVFVHALNAYGMAANRRMNEHNVDLNRNLTHQRKTDPFYAKLNGLINPTSKKTFDFFLFQAMAFKLYYGFDAINQAVTGGQYDFPEGLFYGGSEVEEGTKKLLDWVATHLTQTQSAFIIDVHTGLGKYGEETLVNQSQLDWLSTSPLNGRILPIYESHVLGYKVSGLLMDALREAVFNASKCPREKVYGLLQEFGTYSRYQVIRALRQENMDHNLMHRQGKTLSITSSSRQRLLRAFYPSDYKWRHHIVKCGRDLVRDSLEILSNRQ